MVEPRQRARSLVPRSVGWVALGFSPRWFCVWSSPPPRRLALHCGMQAVHPGKKVRGRLGTRSEQPYTHTHACIDRDRDGDRSRDANGDGDGDGDRDR